MSKKKRSKLNLLPILSSCQTNCHILVSALILYHQHRFKDTASFIVQSFDKPFKMTKLSLRYLQ